MTCAFLLQENFQELSELNTLEKRPYLPHYWSDKGFKDRSLNRKMPSLHEGSLEKTLTVPLIMRILYISWNLVGKLWNSCLKFCDKIAKYWLFSREIMSRIRLYIFRKLQKGKILSEEFAKKKNLLKGQCATLNLGCL